MSVTEADFLTRLEEKTRKPRGRLARARKEPPRAEHLRGYLIHLDQQLDRATVKAIMWTAKVADFRTKRNRTRRALAKLLANG